MSSQGQSNICSSTRNNTNTYTKQTQTNKYAFQAWHITGQVNPFLLRVKLTQFGQTFYSSYTYNPFTNTCIMHLDTITRYTDHVINHKLIKHACTSEGAHANT